MIEQETVRILENTRISDQYWKIRLTCQSHYIDAAPGQFVTMHLPGHSDPLLRRPFSIHRVIEEKGNAAEMEILYRIVGGFTRQLSAQGAGAQLDMLGPIGHGFSVDAHAHQVAIVSGGIGVAPLVFLAERLKASGMDMSAARIFLGGKTKSDILCEDIFSDLGATISVATEDGSAGDKGLVTEPLSEWLLHNNPKVVYACGPHGMLLAVGRIAIANGIHCELSIETLMACGLGVCMGCAVVTNDVTDRYRHVCKDGPVFDAKVLL